MSNFWDSIKAGYLRLIEPVADFLVRRRVHPNVITTLGTACWIIAAVIFATGHIKTAGWVLGLTAIFDVLDGTVARRTGRETAFGAFYDSTLDRIADGAVLGGLLVFYAADGVRHSTPMVIVSLAAIIGTFLTSYTRARAEGLGIDAKVGMIQRPERVVLLSAPQAFFGLAFDGWVLAGIVTLLAVTSWITAIQRISFVHAATQPAAQSVQQPVSPPASPPASPAVVTGTLTSGT
jgi:CDP-diacylglycerol--glycerol-3-phosphate 3-phosphatidyltransferase